MKKTKKILTILVLSFLIISFISICYGSQFDSYRENQFEPSSVQNQFDGKAISEPRSNIGIVLPAMTTLVQVIGIVLVLLVAIVSLIKFILYKIKNSRINSNDEKYEEYKEKSKIAGKQLVISVVAAIVLMIGTGMLGVTRTFKPIIYLYPENDNTEVYVTLSKPERITCSYPKYTDGWNVLADKDGTITDKNRNYYALYWEGLINKKDFKDGFVVKGENTAEFLEEKLRILGLTDKEAEEFIIYWLPKMENNRYNLIRFLEEDELNEEMELNISPKPDTLIRIQMQFKPLLFDMDIPEQKLNEVHRSGFTVVEWGGSKV